MNERIEKLISKAIKAIPDHVDFDLPKEFTEKFAELIVRECARIVNENDCEGSIVGDGMLFEHFGVE
jgi:predicted flavoprotein YhiN